MQKWKQNIQHETVKKGGTTKEGGQPNGNTPKVLERLENGTQQNEGELKLFKISERGDNNTKTNLNSLTT